MSNLSEDEKELLKCLGKARHLSKVVAGVRNSSVRKDGSKTSEETDIQGIGAEYFGAKHFKAPINTSIGLKGDGGFDFRLNLDFDVAWLGVDKSGKPIEDGHLIINPDETERWADVYILVKGSLETGFSIVGWITHKKLISLPQKDFGYGPKYAAEIKDLYKNDLRSLFRNL